MLSEHLSADSLSHTNAPGLCNLFCILRFSVNILESLLLLHKEFPLLSYLITCLPTLYLASPLSMGSWVSSNLQLLQTMLQ